MSALIFVLADQHVDGKILTPVASELYNRGHIIMSDVSGFWAFLKSSGKKVLLLCSDFNTIEHNMVFMTCAQSMYRNIPSVSVQHGFFYGTGGSALNKDGNYETMADICCVWGEYWVDRFATPNTRITGNPYWDTLPRTRNEITGMALLAPSISDRVIQKRDDRADYYIDTCKSYSEYKWIVRPHPMDLKRPDKIEVIKMIANEIGADIQSPMSSSVEDAIGNVDFVMGTSTILCTAHIMQKKDVADRHEHGQVRE